MKEVVILKDKELGSILDEHYSKCANYDRNSVVEAVKEDLDRRSSVGINKYNATLESNNKDNYLQHLFEEQADALLYTKKLLMQSADIKQIIKETPNYYELGEKIAKIYG